MNISARKMTHLFDIILIAHSAISRQHFVTGKSLPVHNLGESRVEKGLTCVCEDLRSHAEGQGCLEVGAVFAYLKVEWCSPLI